MALARNLHRFAEKQLHVLHVEDNLSYSRLIEELLVDVAPFKYKFMRCDKLNQAVELIEKKHFDVILFDLSLPDSDGVQGINVLSRMFPTSPLIVLTGVDKEDLGLEAVRLGAQDYLVKEGCSGALLAKSINYSIERQKIESKIRDQALTDELTQLPNRAAFMQSIEKAISRCDRGGGKFALLYMDFDGFKHINDTYGHVSGDLFLQKIGSRLKKTLRKTDFCARLGGDEFAIFADLHQQPDSNIIPLAKKLLDNLRKPMIIAPDTELYPTCSIGLAVYHSEQTELTKDSLIQAADEAMYRAKKEGGNCYRLYDENLAQEYLKQSLQLVELRTAVRNKKLSVVFQPIVHTNDGSIAGFEALARWRNKENQPIPPDVFIDMLEKNNMICEAGEHIFESACTTFLELRRNIKGKPWLSVNVSPIQLSGKGFVKLVIKMLETANLNFSWLVLEITETTLLSETEKVFANINELVSLGVTIAIDDFGTGYSSMKYLMDIPAEIIKIDGVFVKDIEEISNKQILIGMIRLAHALNKKVIVEGVENTMVRDFFQNLEAEYLQGYYFSKPLDPTQVSEKYF